VSRRLDLVGRECGATYFVVRLAAFTALLAEEVGRDDLLIGTHFSDRRAEFQNTFGCFYNPAVLRLRCDRRSSLRDWSTAVRDAVVQTQSRSAVPVEQLYEELFRSGVRPRAVSAMFMASDHTAPVRFGGLEMRCADRRAAWIPWGFTVQFDQHNEQHRCRARFNARAFDPAGVQAFLDRYKRFLDAVSAAPERPLGEVLAACRT
jgi:non-ribosomal peptide synthetase component F